MALKLPIRRSLEPVLKMVTDLDQSDNNPKDEKSKKPHRHRERKELKNYSGNFPNRSRSADTRFQNKPEQGGKGDKGYLRVLVEAKDEQIEKLVGKISDLHTYNNQYAVENERLQAEVNILTENLQLLAKNFEQTKKEGCKICQETKEIEETWKSEKDDLLNTNKALRNDVDMMKTLVYRLNVQVERYQEMLRKSSNATDEEPDVQSAESPTLGKRTSTLNWGSVNSHTLAPLLNAYQEMVRDKDALVKQYEREMNRFTGSLKGIMEENERLQQEMDETRKGNDGWKEDKTRLQAQLEICRGKAEVQTKRADLAKEKLVEVLRCYEQKVQAQSLDIERLQEAYTRSKTELTSLRSVTNQPEVVVESLKECQRLFEELKAQHDNERKKVTTEISDFQQRNIELEDKLLKLREENTNLKIIVEKNEEMYSEMKKKHNVMRQNMNRLRESRDNLRTRLRTALQWAKKLEASREKVRNTWSELKELEVVIRQKEAQMRGLQVRHEEEVDKLERKLQQREDTIKSILKEKAKAN